MNGPIHDQEDSKSCRNAGSWWRLPLLLGVVLFVLIALRGGVRQEMTGGEQSSESHAKNNGGIDEKSIDALPVGDGISLSIDFGNGTVSEFARLEWHPDMTVADVMATATGRNGPIKYARQGAGAMAFLTQINAVTNEGTGGRNWIYSVNGEMADRSFAIYELRPGDRILWSFAAPE